MAFEKCAARWIWYAWHADMHVKGRRDGSGGIVYITALESALTVVANAIGRNEFPKTVYWRNKMRGRTWRVNEVDAFLHKHDAKGRINVTSQFDILVLRYKVRSHLAMVDAASTFHTYEGVVTHVHDQAMSVEKRVGEGD